MSEPAPLVLRDVEAAYGPFRALFGVSIRVEAGAAVALLGANGAGKTTLARVATGLLAPSGGRVLVDGADLTGERAWRFARAGVVHAPEGRSVFATLTVEENLRLAFASRGRRGATAAVEQAYGMFPVLRERFRQVAGTLSGGEQRILSLAQALVARPRLLVVDELSFGLAPLIVKLVYETLEVIRNAGTALLVVEQYIGPALEIADHVVLLSHGEIAWEGSPEDARAVVVDTAFGAPRS